MRIAFNRICCHHGILFPAKGFPQKDSRSHGCASCHLTGRSPAVVLPSSLLGLSPLSADLEAPLSPLPFPVPSLKPRPPAPPGSRCGVRPPHPSAKPRLSPGQTGPTGQGHGRPRKQLCAQPGAGVRPTLCIQRLTLDPKLTSSKGP